MQFKLKSFLNYYNNNIITSQFLKLEIANILIEKLLAKQIKSKIRSTKF